MMAVNVKDVAEQLERTRLELRAARQDAKAADAKVAQLERREASLSKRMERAPRDPVELDPHKQAGPKNVELMRSVFREGRVLTVAEATRRAGFPSGHQTWAIRALEDEGQIVPTGRKDGRSVEYKFVSRKRRRTRLGPGE